MLNIALFGPPGAGKGTQRVQIIASHPLVLIAPGDMFREEIDKGSELGKELAVYMHAGHLVPEELTLRAVANKMALYPHTTKFLFDGFPRSLVQAEALDKLLAERNSTLDLVIFLEVDPEEAAKRILGRSRISGRVDDQEPAKIVKRIEVYTLHTLPVATYYAKQGKLVHIAGGESIEQVANRISQAIASMITQ